MTTITVDDVRRAEETIDGAVLRTPSSLSRTLSDILGATVILKFEIFQFTGAYKERGARNKLESLTPDERAAGVVAVSAGNHAQAVAYHARELGIPATIVMPKGTPFVKAQRTRFLGAGVELFGDTFEEALDRGLELVEKGLTFIHPFDDPLIIAGQGTVALEMLADHPEIDTLVVPVGGGGLISGCAIVAHAIAPHVRVIGAQTERFPSMVRYLAGDTNPVQGGVTIADGIAVTRAGKITPAIVKELVSEVLVVSEHALEEGVNLLLEVEKVVVEGAGAAGIAALLDHRDHFEGRTVGVILTGGNIDPRLLAALAERGLVRSGRLSRLRVILDDRPGALAQLLSIVGEAGGNILEVQHQRLFAELPVRLVDVDLAIETADSGHRDAIIRSIIDAGYRAVAVPLDRL